MRYCLIKQQVCTCTGKQECSTRDEFFVGDIDSLYEETADEEHEHLARAVGSLEKEELL